MQHIGQERCALSHADAPAAHLDLEAHMPHTADALRRIAQLLRLLADTLDPPILTQQMGPARITYHDANR